MSRDLLIGVDAGTSVIKSVAFTRDGEQVGACARANLYHTVRGWAPSRTWPPPGPTPPRA